MLNEDVKIHYFIKKYKHLIITQVVAVFFHYGNQIITVIKTILIFKPTQSTQNMLNNRKHILEQST